MLAVLPRLMSPLVAALGASDALATLGLRTMEYWVDSLNPEFLEPAMAPVVPALMRALWAHLRPLPYPFGAKVRRSSAMRTLAHPSTVLTQLRVQPKSRGFMNGLPIVRAWAHTCSHCQMLVKGSNHLKGYSIGYRVNCTPASGPGQR